MADFHYSLSHSYCQVWWHIVQRGQVLSFMPKPQSICIICQESSAVSYYSYEAYHGDEIQLRNGREWGKSYFKQGNTQECFWRSKKSIKSPFECNSDPFLWSQRPRQSRGNKFARDAGDATGTGLTLNTATSISAGKKHGWHLVHSYKESAQKKWWILSTVFSTWRTRSHVHYRQYESAHPAVQSQHWQMVPSKQ